MACGRSLSPAALQGVAYQILGSCFHCVVEMDTGFLDSSDKERRTINGNNLALFATSLQCTDKFSLVSR